MPSLTILHTADLHGTLKHGAAERIRAEKSAAESCLLLDSGDAISSGNVYYRPGGEPILKLMNEVGYDAMAMGNREFHFLRAGLECKIKLARFPVLSANLHSKDADVHPSVVPTAYLRAGELTVGVFGLTVPMITKRMLASKVSPFWFEDPLDAAGKAVAELRERADVVVALTHIGLEADVALAGRVKGIDLIVGGHTHTALNEPMKVEDTSIVHSGWWCRYLGKANVRIRRGGVEVSGALIKLGQ